MNHLLEEEFSAKGSLVAQSLRTAWRLIPEPLSISPDEFSTVTDVLLRTGAGALAWRRLRAGDVETAPQRLCLQDAYRKHSIEAALHEINTADIFKRARAAGIEPILFKGWALARLYPEAGLRPHGDIDLWVRPEDLRTLYDVLPSDDHQYCVEPHDFFYPQYERSFDEVWSKSKLIKLADIDARVPCDEDHLRFICLHFLFHGGWRPLWLCDIALMVETRSENFDWDRCLRGKRKHADWIAGVIGLAHQLLGADVSDTPVTQSAKDLPAWLMPAVLKQWGLGAGMSHAETLSFSIPRRLFKPGAFLDALREHWRNPIQASVEMNAWFDNKPRLTFQIAAAISKMPGLAGNLIPEMNRARLHLLNSIQD